MPHYPSNTPHHRSNRIRAAWLGQASRSLHVPLPQKNAAAYAALLRQAMQGLRQRLETAHHHAEPTRIPVRVSSDTARRLRST